MTFLPARLNWKGAFTTSVERNRGKRLFRVDHPALALSMATASALGKVRLIVLRGAGAASA
ncbi:hypothetical protein DYH55_02940 [Methylovirgula sp. 4M-Z18]|nr:hypothetical protein DYH55_02940 [Methylovirgula sp. 4M-Z18]